MAFSPSQTIVCRGCVANSLPKNRLKTCSKCDRVAFYVLSDVCKNYPEANHLCASANKNIKQSECVTRQYCKNILCDLTEEKKIKSLLDLVS